MPAAESRKAGVGEKRKRIAPEPSNRHQIKSAEYIEDSDDEDDAKPSQSASKGQPKQEKRSFPFPANKQILPNANTAKITERKSKEKLAAPRTRSGSSTSDGKRKESSSSEDEHSGSQSSSSSEAAEERTQAVKPTAPKKPSSTLHDATAILNHQDNSSSSSEEAEDAGSTHMARAITDKKEQDDESEDESSEGEDATTSKEKETSDSSDSEEDGDEHSDKMIIDDEHTDGQTPKTRADSIPTPLAPYEAPRGFEPATISLAPSSGLAELFTPANMEGKQIWHITAPADVPLTSVKQITKQSIIDGSTILSHNMAEYGLVSDNTEASITPINILIPSVDQNAYVRSHSTVSKTLHLQQQIKLPTHASALRTEDRRPPDHYKVAKARNEQPPGLKMRHHAFGVPGASFSDTDSEIESPEARQSPQRPTLERPASPRETSPSKKRPHSEIDGQLSTLALSAPKAKKPKNAPTNDHTPSKPVARASTTKRATANPPSLPAEAKNLPIKEDNPVVSGPADRESPEIRAKRKAEKHQRKLREPFRVPHTALPGKALSNGVSKEAIGASELNNDNDITMADADDNAPGDADHITESPKLHAPSSMKSDQDAKMAGIDPNASMHVRPPSPPKDIPAPAETPDPKEEKKRRKQERKRRKDSASKTHSTNTDKIPAADPSTSTNPSMKSDQQATATGVHPTANMNIRNPSPTRDSPTTSLLAASEEKRRRHRKEARTKRRTDNIANADEDKLQATSSPRSPPPPPTQSMKSQQEALAAGVTPDAKMRDRAPEPVGDGVVSGVVTTSGVGNGAVEEKRARKEARKRKREGKVRRGEGGENGGGG